MDIPIKTMVLSTSGRTILVCGDYSKVFPLIVNLVEINPDNSLLLLDDFNIRAMLNEIDALSINNLSGIRVSGFESLVELDKVLEHSETLLLKDSFSLLVLGSMSNAYLRDISLHESSSHPNILHLFNKTLAFFSFLSKNYGCTGILIGPSGGLDGVINIPAKRIFLYWVDYVLDVRKCEMGGTVGELTARSGEKLRLCIPTGKIKKTSDIGECNKDDCPRTV